ncbi:MAG: 2-hydroxyacid dehydrogenase [Halomonadaceae bacterium]|nr:MAG: 2-hydroxyacid dehydrogenase [Halomonadaceae bacterium]
MKVAVFSTKEYDREFLNTVNAQFGHDMCFFEVKLIPDTASLADGFPAVCAFVNDDLSAPVLHALHRQGTRLIALRSSGFNHVDLHCADKLGMTIVRVPAYSPHAVAEHALALILGLNRKTHRAFNRVREGNFSLDGLLGFDIRGKTVGVVGTGEIGHVFARIMHSLGCRILASDPDPDPEVRQFAHYVELDQLFRESDIISLHCPLIPQTRHLIDDNAVSQMKQGVMLINTSRGKVVDTQAIITGLKSRKIAYLGLDVYEEESDLFFSDLSQEIIDDDVFMRLLTFPNVLITGHQGFFTQEALTAIAQVTLSNIAAYENSSGEMHCVTTEHVS